VITNEVIRSFLDCPYKSFLKFHHKSGDKTEFERLECELLNDTKTKFRKSLQTSLHEHQILQQIPEGKGNQLVETQYVIEPLFQSNDYTINFDVIEISPDKQSSGEFSYVPIEVVAKEAVSKLDKLSFAIKSHIISQIQQCTPEFGKIVYGRNLKTIKIHISDYLKEVKRVLKKLIKTISSKEAPRFFQNRYCSICEFYIDCNCTLST